MDLHHVGIATADGGDLATLFESLLEAPVVHEEVVDELEATFLGCANGYLELLEPTPDASGPIASFLDESGPGVHHVAFATDDVTGALDRAREAGIELVDEEPRPGAWGHEVAFLHPRDTGGVLIEFVGE